MYSFEKNKLSIARNTAKPLRISFFFSVLLLCTVSSNGQSLAQRMKEAGMVDVAKLDPTIYVNLMYARADNFTGKVLYKDLNQAFLHPNAAKALVRASAILHRTHPDVHLLICDGARPMSVQKTMWQTVARTSKNRYVSNPAHGGGLHNYGLAVDITLADKYGQQLPMGTNVDYMGEAAHTIENILVAKGLITKEEKNNRLLLRRVMRQAGFIVLRSEWWHFNYCSRAEARKNYKVIN